MPARIAVDFNTMMMDPKERVYIAKEGSARPNDHEVLEILHLGQSAVLLYDGEMEVVATPEFDTDYRVWFGRPDWSTRRELCMSH